MSSVNLDELKERLSQLESRLRELLGIASRDLQLAKRLQTLVVKNRLPSIPGIELLARHFSGSDVSAEAFDIIPTKDFRELFVVCHWSESFGLSSVLLQAMVHLQMRAAVESHPKIDARTLYNEILSALRDYNPKGEFRLSMLRLDVHTLKFDHITKGFFPWLCLHQKTWSTIDGHPLKDVDPKTLQAHAEAPVFETQGLLKPGSKLFFVSTEWNYEARTSSSFTEPLGLDKLSAEESLLELINKLLFVCEEKVREEETSVDITALAIAVDSKKIHLA